MDNTNSNTTDAQVAAQNAEAANANPGESASSASGTSATAPSTNTGSVGLTGNGSDANSQNPTVASAAGAPNTANTSAATGAVAKNAASPSSPPANPNPAPLAGTSGKAPGTNTTGMAASGNAPKKLTPSAVVSKTPGANAGVDSPNVNVKHPGAVNPVVGMVSSRIAELKTIVGAQEKTPWIQRALKDLQTAEEWVVQHFEEMKRKV